MQDTGLITGGTTGVLHIPADYATPRRGLSGLWRRHVIANASVRNREYMESLFNARFPGSELIFLEEGRVPSSLAVGADNIVLLYPDSIGLDFRHIERELVRRWPSKRLLVLNGRGRLFRLDKGMLHRLLFLRFLESFRIPEIAFLIVFLLTTPFLVLVDFFRDRR